MLQKPSQIPNLMQSIDNYVFQRRKHMKKYTYDSKVTKMFDDAYEDQQYHNPLMAYAVQAGIIQRSTRYMSLSKYNIHRQTEVIWVYDKNIAYSPYRNKSIKHKVMFYYDPFITSLFINGKLEEYIRCCG